MAEERFQRKGAKAQRRKTNKFRKRSRPGGTVHRDDAHLCLDDEVALALSDEELCYMKAGRREGVIWIIAEAAQPVP